MIDFCETIVAMRKELYNIIHVGGRIDPNVQQFQMHPVTFRRFVDSCPKWLVRYSTAFHLFEVDGIPLKEDSSIPTGEFRLVSVHGGAKLKLIDNGFQDESEQ